MARPYGGTRARGSSSAEEVFGIGELARRTGLTVRTIRYYEERGLLPPRGRGALRPRVYSDRDLRRLQLVCGLKNLGSSLAEIRRYVRAGDATPDGRVVDPRVAEELGGRIARRIEELEALARVLEPGGDDP